MQSSGFFNGVADAQGNLDRVYDATQFADYFALFVGNGVFQNPLDQLLVIYTGGEGKAFTLIVKRGWAFIDGYWYHNSDDLEITVAPNTGSYTIYNSICVTLDRGTRTVSIQNNVNVNNGYPVNNGSIHELVLCRYAVKPNSTSLSTADLEDKRPDPTYCGFVAGIINQIDAGEVFTQMDTVFNEWFETIKGKLSSDIAGSLQNQIDAIPTIRSGSTEPDNSVGKNGDIYVRYEL